MGLFNKLKSSMNGGVRVHVQAPSSVPSNQVIQVSIAVTSDSSQIINSVKAQIKAQAKEQGFTMGGGQGVGVQEGRTMEQTVAQAESREPFTIGSGETKTVNLQLYLNGGAAGTGPMGQMGNAGGAIGGVLQTMASLAQNFDHVNYIYTVHGSVDVQGHSLNPSDKQPIQILPPSESVQTALAPQIDNPQPQSPMSVSQPQMPMTSAQPQPDQPIGPNPTIPSE